MSEIPAPGTTRYLCPLECGWHHDDPPPSAEDLAGIVPDPNFRHFSDLVGSIASKAAMRRLERTEAALRGHLEEHSVEEFARMIHGLTGQREGLAQAVRDQAATIRQLQDQVRDMDYELKWRRKKMGDSAE